MDLKKQHKEKVERMEKQFNEFIGNMRRSQENRVSGKIDVYGD